jgi:MFS family permease
MFGRALTSVLWGMIADRYGRKPVILVGMIMLLVQLIMSFLFCNSYSLMQFCKFQIEFLILVPLLVV